MRYLLVSNLDGDRVRAIGLLALDPLDEAAEHRARSTARALASDGGQLPVVLFLHAVEARKGGDQAGQASSRGSQAGARGEGVDGGDVHVVLVPVLLAHKHLSRGGVHAILGEPADLGENRLSTAVERRLLAVQPKSIGGEGLRGGHGGDGVQILLRCAFSTVRALLERYAWRSDSNCRMEIWLYLVEGHTRRGIHGGVQLDIALAPVLDHRDCAPQSTGQVMEREGGQWVSCAHTR